MSVKVQYRGICQCCGRLQAVLANGFIAKHGYTVEYGWFNGVCRGHHYKPLQISRDGTDSFIHDARVKTEENIRQLEAFQAGENPTHVTNGEYVHGLKNITWEEATELQRRKGKRIIMNQLEDRIQAGKMYIESMTQMADSIHGTPLVEVKLLKEDGIKVGDTVRILGETVVVTRIEYAVARGVGPSINGQSVEHIFWMKGDRELKYPKRYARRAKIAEA